MTSEDEQVSSDVFDLPNPTDSLIFPVDSGQFKSPISRHHSCDHYLREGISEPLSCALAYVIIYRPEDPIEFISDFLINWSRQKRINHQSNNVVEQTFVNEDKDSEHSLEEREIVSESDKHLSSLFYQETSRVNSHRDDEKGELSRYFEEQKQQTHRTHLQQYIHTHDTASGFDDHDQMKSIEEQNKRNHRCQDGNLSSFTYFSKLREKIIKYDES